MFIVSFAIPIFMLRYFWKNLKRGGNFEEFQNDWIEKNILKRLQIKLRRLSKSNEKELEKQANKFDFEIFSYQKIII